MSSRTSSVIELERPDVELACEQRMLASIRDTVRNLPANRHEEIFNDFKRVMELGDINYLADAISNWALGGHGYDYAGTIVNRTIEGRSKLLDNPALNQLWLEHMERREREEEADRCS